MSYLPQVKVAYLLQIMSWFQSEQWYTVGTWGEDTLGYPDGLAESEASPHGGLDLLIQREDALPSRGGGQEGHTPCCIREPIPNQKLLSRVKLFSTTSEPGLQG